MFGKLKYRKKKKNAVLSPSKPSWGKTKLLEYKNDTFFVSREYFLKKKFKRGEKKKYIWDMKKREMRGQYKLGPSAARRDGRTWVWELSWS